MKSGATPCARSLDAALDDGRRCALCRHANALRDWFSQTAVWVLHIERDCARLYKRAADLDDPSRGAPGFERRRYVLFCLACLALERADPQITL